MTNDPQVAVDDELRNHPLAFAATDWLSIGHWTLGIGHSAPQARRGQSWVP